MHHPHHSIHDQAARTGGTQPQIFSSDIWALAQLSDYPLGVPLDHPAELPYAIEDLRNKRFAAVGRTTPDSSRIAELVPGGDGARGHVGAAARVLDDVGLVHCVAPVCS